MARITDRGEFGSALYIAEFRPQAETLGWQTGSIDPGIQSDEALKDLADAVIASLAPVPDEEKAYSDCTDGRTRIGLLNGAPAVPVREKLVGADTVTAFAMAESLGARFYGNDKATARERVNEVVLFLKDSKLMPSTHEACGAAGGFVPVSQNVVSFAANENFVQRQRDFVPAFDIALFGRMTARLDERIASGAYESYSDALITDAVRTHAGDEAVARYLDDGRGVHGHTELAIARLQDIEGVSVDPNHLAGLVPGGQVFTVNDNRIARLASLFGRGHDEDFATAFMAGEAFSDAGHGTLGRNLRTIVIRPAA